MLSQLSYAPIPRRDPVHLSATANIISNKFGFVNPFFEIFSDFFWNPQNARIMGVLGLFLGVEGGFSAKNARATNYFTQLESLAQSAASLSPGAKRTI